MKTFQLAANGAFSPELNLTFLRRSPRELLHLVDDDGVWKALKLDQEKFVVRVGLTDHGVAGEIVGGKPSKRFYTYAEQYLREWFDLDTDLNAFYAAASKDKIMSVLTEQFKGYRIIGQPDLYESISWAVIGQQINLPFAFTLKQRFVEQFGERVRYKQRDHYLFPEARIIASINPDILLPHQFSRQKSKYLVNIAQAFASGDLSTEKLREMSFDEAKEKLMAIKGVGNWTANYALMKTYRYPNAFPLEDAGIHNAIRNLKNMDRKPTLDEVTRYFKKFKGWEAYATLYLWKSL